MHVIAKMNVQSVEDFGVSKKIKFQCVHDNQLNIGENPENRAFTKATPWGEAAMTIDNMNVWPEFRVCGGSPTYEQPSEHYVVFIDAKKHSYADIQTALAFLERNEACVAS